MYLVCSSIIIMKYFSGVLHLTSFRSVYIFSANNDVFLISSPICLVYLLAYSCLWPLPFAQCSQTAGAFFSSRVLLIRIPSAWRTSFLIFLIPRWYSLLCYTARGCSFNCSFRLAYIAIGNVSLSWTRYLIVYWLFMLVI